MEHQIFNIAKEISDYMGSILTKRAYIAIAGRNGELYYIDEEYTEYIEFVQNLNKLLTKSVVDGRNLFC